MLVLSRQVGQKIMIGDNVVVTVVRLQGGKCRLGIDAPVHLRIDKGENLPGAPAPSAERRANE